MLHVDIDHDCWIIIINQLYGDFRTLSRLMRVSRLLMMLTAPRLYAQLGDVENTKRVMGWSIKKRKRLTTLILVSLGLVSVESELKAGIQEHISLVRITDGSSAGKSPSIDYFSLLKRLPKELIGIDTWRQLLKPALLFKERKATDHDEQQTLPRTNKRFETQDSGILVRIAKVLTEIEVESLSEADHWFSAVHHLSNLSTLVFPGPPSRYVTQTPFSTEMKSKLVEFVVAHKKIFPQMLTIMGSRHICSEVGDFVMELNTLLQPKAISMWSLQDINHQLTRPDWWNLVQNLKSFYFKDLRDVNEHVETVRNLSKFFQQSLNLTKIELWNQNFPDHVWTNFFQWAKEKQKLLKGDDQRYQKTGNYDQSIIQLHEFTAKYIPSELVFQVMDVFRFSLESLEFRNRSEGILGTNWTWPLSRLTVLRLTDCVLVFPKLELCPVLQELDLYEVHSAVPPLEDGLPSAPQWRISHTMKHSLKSLRLAQGDSFEVLDLNTLGDAHELEEILIDHGLFELGGPDHVLETVSSTNWWFPKLKKLTLNDDDSAEFWQKVFLKSSPNLQLLATRTYSIGTKNGWWSDVSKNDFQPPLLNLVSGQHNDGHADIDHNDETAVCSVLKTKIRHLTLGNHCTEDQLQQFIRFFENSEFILPTTRTGLEESLPGKTMSNIFVGICFPHLTHIVFYSTPNHQSFAEYGSWRKTFQQLLVNLLKRPRMKWIDVVVHKLSSTFKQDQLVLIDSESVPQDAGEFTENEDDDDAEHDSKGSDSDSRESVCEVRGCILKTYDVRTSIEFYQLKPNHQ